MLIAQMSDLHLSRDPAFLGGRVDPRACLERAAEHLQCLDPQPDLLVLTGDLTDNGEAVEYAMLRECLAELPMRVLAIPGNHDASTVMQKCLAEWMPAVDATHGCFVVEDLPLRVLGLDTTVPRRAAGRLCEQRLDWLAHTLADRPGAPALLLMHHPPFATGIAAMDACGLLQGGAMLATLIARHGAVVGVLCGHIHRSIQSVLGGAPVHVAASVAHQITLALSPGAKLNYCLEPGCISLHRWQPGAALVSHTSYVTPFPGPYRF